MQLQLGWLRRVHLRTIIIIADADGTLATKAVRPVATKLNVGLWDPGEL